MTDPRAQTLSRAFGRALEAFLPTPVELGKLELAPGVPQTR